MRQSGWLVPAAASLAVFVWLLTLHPAAAGRVYAAYGGVYVSVAILWLWAVDAVRPSPWDWLGVVVCLVGMAIIMFSPLTPNRAGRLPPALRSLGERSYNPVRKFWPRHCPAETRS